MIDIDVQKSKGLGSPEGAKTFASHLNKFWSDLYFETSTNGQGIHGYFILSKLGIDAKRTNASLKRLEKWLRSEAKRINSDIEEVEIKGTCLHITFDNGMAQAVTFGVPAKLPRDVSRFAEWEKTTQLRVLDLESRFFDVAEVEDQVKISVVQPKFPEIISLDTPRKAISPRIIKNEIVSGSVSNKFIDDDQLKCIPSFEILYRKWVGATDLMAGKFRVTSHDFAIAMVLLKYFKENQNCDKSLPCRRVAALWTALFEAGDVDRGWNHHRWKVIRDFLSERGHIDWTDHRYEQSSTGQNGEKTSKGIACKWEISDEYVYCLEKINEMNKGGTSFVDTNLQKLIPEAGKGQNLSPILCSVKAIKFWEQLNEFFELAFAA